jgi:drug/metabolite transporter (DMT)-like permease
MNGLSAPVRAMLWMLAQTTCMVAMMAATRKLSLGGMPTHEVAFFRGFFGLLVMLPWLVATLRTEPHILHPPEWKLVWARNTLSVVGILFWFAALGGIPISDVVAVQFTHPLFVVIGAALILHERVGAWRWSAVAIGAVGALIIIRPGYLPTNPLVYAVLFSAMMNGGVQLITKHISGRVSGAVMVFYMNLLILPVCLPFAWSDWVWPSLGDLPWVLAVGLFGTLAHVFLARAMKVADASLVGPVDFMRLPIAALFGWVLFAEYSDLPTWSGAVIIVVAAIVIARREARLAANK